jgi:large subunit ribosomal protein L32
LFFGVIWGKLLRMSIRMRHTSGHTKNRRSHHKLTETRLSKDTETGGLHVRHRVNMSTGRYRGKVVIDVARLEEKKADKARRRVLEERGDGNEPQEDKKPINPEELSKH